MNGADMGVEDKIAAGTHDREARRKREDADARQFAEAVISRILGLTVEPDDSLAVDDADRLAAIFVFLMGQCVECLNAEQDLNSTRSRLAIGAIHMLGDITNKQRGPAHKFFKGLTSLTPSKTTNSRDVNRQMRLAACVSKIVELERDKGTRRADAIRKVVASKLSRHFLSAEQLASSISRFEAAHPEWLKTGVNLLNRFDVADTEQVINTTAALLQILDGPFDFRDALSVRDRAYILSDGKGGLAIQPPRSMLADELQLTFFSGNDKGE